MSETCIHGKGENGCHECQQDWDRRHQEHEKASKKRKLNKHQRTHEKRVEVLLEKILKELKKKPR